MSMAYLSALLPPSRLLEPGCEIYSLVIASPLRPARVSGVDMGRVQRVRVWLGFS